MSLVVWACSVDSQVFAASCSMVIAPLFTGGLQVQVDDAVWQGTRILYGQRTRGMLTRFFV